MSGDWLLMNAVAASNVVAFIVGYIIGRDRGRWKP